MDAIFFYISHKYCKKERSFYDIIMSLMTLYILGYTAFFF
jgi:hypothetical protein